MLSVGIISEKRNEKSSSNQVGSKNVASGSGFPFPVREFFFVNNLLSLFSVQASR